MADMIPATSLVAAALRRVTDAEENLKSAASHVPPYHRDEFRDALAGLAVASELLSMIIGPAPTRPNENAAVEACRPIPVIAIGDSPATEADEIGF